MLIEVLKSKIHCARVTEANLNYMAWAASPSTRTCWTPPT